MRTSCLGAFAGVALAGALAVPAGVAGADGADTIQGDPWVLVDKRINLESSDAIAFSAPNEGWVVGTNFEPPSPVPFAMRWDGATWTEARIGDFVNQPQSLNRVATLAADEAWATGTLEQARSATASPRPGSGLWYRDEKGALPDSTPRAVAGAGPAPYALAKWNGSEWAPEKAPAPPAGKQALVAELKTVGAEIWAVGLEHDAGQASGQQAFIDRYQNGKWRRMVLPGDLTTKPSALFGLTGADPDDVWLSGAFPTPEKDTPFVAHWDGKKFDITELPIPLGFSNGWNADVVAVMGDEVFVTGRSLYTDGTLATAYRFDGSAWTQWTGRALAEVNDISVAADGNSMMLGGWPSLTSDQSEYAAFDGTTWTRHGQPEDLGVHRGQVLNVEHLPGTDRVMAVGYVNAPDSGYSYITANK
ncbi:hypothetical protein SAMN05216266_1074 [Amycolatopsis marina]|uniref:Uncharacterized protein n=1 Tax=Amycolatopsis marina TaxID=490629 RepID=A0A1I0ZHF5_9PSEU|nr:hypothetical protein [Amycolatopsis marina]SFB25199.1 hypothetical protein SAMN05216266_1074 [Amycolatopsis marina]